MRLAWLLLFMGTLLRCSCYKVLVYAPRIGHSHVAFLGTVADVLVEEGFDVVADLHPAVTNNGTKLAKTLFAKPEPEVSAHLGTGDGLSELIWKAETKNPLDQIELYKTTRWMFSTYCQNLYNQQELMDQLKSERFDVVISEAFDVCIFGALKWLGAKSSIIASSTILLENTYLNVGVPLFPSFLPDKMTFTEKIKNIIGMGIVGYYGSDVMDGIQQLSNEKFGNDATNIKQELSECSFVLVNADPLLDFAHPTLEKVINIGGIAIRAPKPLDEEWNRILSLRIQNVLISFGSVAASHAMPGGLKTAFLQMIRQYPDVTFIWKYERPEDEISKGIPNLVETQWMPQNDILRDPRTSLFITHGGMNSVTESASGGVPMLVIPVFADQMRNAKMVVRGGIGLDLDKHDIPNTDDLAATLGRLLKDKTFKSNAERLARMMKNRPTPVKDLLTNHVRFAAEFGKLPNLRPISIDMSLIEYFCLGVISVVIFVVSVIVFVIFSLTVLSQQIQNTIHTNGTKLAKVIPVDVDRSLVDFFSTLRDTAKFWTTENRNPLTQLTAFREYRKRLGMLCDDLLSHEEIFDQLTKEQFDLAISEVFDPCLVGTYKAIGVKAHVVASASILFEPTSSIVGAPFPLISIPASVSGFTDKMTFYERMKNVIAGAVMHWSFMEASALQQPVLDRRGYGNIEEEIADCSLIITNSEPLLDFPRPTLDKIINIGGVSIPKLQKLDTFWEEVLSRRRHTVLITFGSIAESHLMPEKMKTSLLTAFSKLPNVTFIWKHEKLEHDIAKHHPNVVATNWVPQNDLLNHPKLKLFITHGGMNSILETANRGVPVVVVPLFGDQMRNAKMAVRAGIGKEIHKTTLYDHDEFVAVISEILEDAKYSAAAKRLV